MGDRRARYLASVPSASFSVRMSIEIVVDALNVFLLKKKELTTLRWGRKILRLVTLGCGGSRFIIFLITSYVDSVSYSYKTKSLLGKRRAFKTGADGLNLRK